MPPISFLDELAWRGLIHQATDEPALRAHLADPAHHPRRAYVGYDPTADSLTIGNLVTIMLLVHFARAGHTPVVVMGGGTGLIGDPSGKSAERTLRSADDIANNVQAQRSIFARVFAGAGLPAPDIHNNLDWLGRLSFLDALRDVGKHFSVNMMIQKDSVRERLHHRDQGISYTEFSYMLLQAYDYAHLHQHHHVTLQMGGSDQFGNIVCGSDFIRTRARRELEAHAHAHALPAADIERRWNELDRSIHTFGLTAPLVTKSDGTKFGKTESGAVWLTAPAGPHDTSPARTTPFAYFQFWLNADDADVPRFLRIFTLLTKDEIEALERAHAADPAKREAHRALARAATAILHGPTAARAAEHAANALFSGDVASLDEPTFSDALAGVPTTDLPRARLDAPGLDPVELLTAAGIAKSNREAREFIQAGSVSVNGRKLAPADRLTAQHLLHGRYLALRRGKKNWHLARFD